MSTRINAFSMLSFISQHTPDAKEKKKKKKEKKNKKKL